jgi:hypothetical protein
MRYQVVSVMALAQGSVVPGDILDDADPKCPIPPVDLVRLADAGHLRALTSAPEVPEARAKKGKETR